MEEHWPPLVRALTEPARYPHPVDGVSVVETHISYVLLTGDFAYKIKKPLDLGFLDFTDLEKRRHACDEEVRINRRTAPELYLGVWPVTGRPEDPILNGDGEPFEFVVRMVQFDPDQGGDRCLERGVLKPGHMRSLGDRLAELHETAAYPPGDSDYGTAREIRAEQEANLEQLEQVLHGAELSQERFETLAGWVSDCLTEFRQRFDQRRPEGLVRECHGDLHLGNLVLRGGELIPFDAIEFDPALRFTDVIADVAFAWMDLLARGRRDLGVPFLNRYLERTGDYSGLRLLPFYTVYRALIRCKVAALRVAEADGEARGEDARLAAEYFELAEGVAGAGRPLLVIARGVTGVGKSTVSEPVLEDLGGIRIRSDVERKRLAGLAPEESGASRVGKGIYGAELTERTYERLLQLARPALLAGFPVLLDATFLEEERRRAARELASDLRVPFAILALEAPERTIRSWIRERARSQATVSDADESVLEHQLREQDPLGPEEEGFAIRLDTSKGPDPGEVARRLEEVGRVPGPDGGPREAP